MRKKRERREFWMVSWGGKKKGEKERRQEETEISTPRGRKGGVIGRIEASVKSIQEK